MDLPHGLGIEPRSTVGKVVASDAGDGGIFELHLLDALGHTSRLVAVQRRRLPGVDLAEVTATGALLAADQEGCLAVFPALDDVRAAGLLAVRVQALALHELNQLVLLRTPLGFGLDTLWPGLGRAHVGTPV